MHTIRIAPIAATLLLLMTACDSGGGTPSSSSVLTASASPSATPTITPVVTPTPTRTLDPHPALVDLRITTQGLLPLTIGMDATTNPGAAMITWDPANCDAEFAGDPTQLGRWVAAYPGYPFGLNGHYAPAITRIDIWVPGLQTPEGIHVGSTLADLTAAYPGLVAGTPAFSTTPYWISDSSGFVVFEVGSGTVEGAPGPDQIWFIRVLDAGSDPDYAIASSGNVAGACF